MSQEHADPGDRPVRVPAARRPEREIGIRELRNAGRVVADGLTLATGSADGTVILWDLSPDGRTLATGSGDQTLRLWDVTSY